MSDTLTGLHFSVVSCFSVFDVSVEWPFQVQRVHSRGDSALGRTCRWR